MEFPGLVEWRRPRRNSLLFRFFGRFAERRNSVQAYGKRNLRWITPGIHRHSSVSSTTSCVPGSQRRCCRIALGRNHCPLVETIVAAFGSRELVEIRLLILKEILLIQARICRRAII